MLKSQLIQKLHNKYKHFSEQDIENLLDIFLKKISVSLKDGKNIEIRGFGTISRKDNKEKFVRNPKTNEKIFKEKSYKVHFKIGKTLHKKLNSQTNNEF